MLRIVLLANSVNMRRIAGVVVTDISGSRAGGRARCHLALTAMRSRTRTWHRPAGRQGRVADDRTCHELRIARNKIPSDGKKRNSSAVPACLPASLPASPPSCLTERPTDRPNSVRPCRGGTARSHSFLPLPRHPIAHTVPLTYRPTRRRRTETYFELRPCLP